MFNMWKAHKLWPWQWLTNGVVYIEHISALEVMDRWFEDAKKFKQISSNSSNKPTTTAPPPLIDPAELEQ